MKTAEARKLIGKQVEWEELHDRHRGTCFVRTGVIKDVKSKNVWINGDVKWLPNMINLKPL